MANQNLKLNKSIKLKKNFFSQTRLIIFLDLDFTQRKNKTNLNSHISEFTNGPVYTLS